MIISVAVCICNVSMVICVLRHTYTCILVVLCSLCISSFDAKNKMRKDSYSVNELAMEDRRGYYRK